MANTDIFTQNVTDPNNLAPPLRVPDKPFQEITWQLSCQKLNSDSLMPPRLSKLVLKMSLLIRKEAVIIRDKGKGFWITLLLVTCLSLLTTFYSISHQYLTITRIIETETLLNEDRFLPLIGTNQQYKNEIAELIIGEETAATPEREISLHFTTSEEEITTTLSLAIHETSDQLQAFLDTPNFPEKMYQAFGENAQYELAKSAIQDLIKGEIWIDIEVIPIANLRAKGAFGNNIIYLAEEFLEENLNNSQAISKVLLEELGHYFDSVLNGFDSPGDEGEIFARLVQQDEPLTNEELLVLKGEDDSAIIIVNGETIVVEQAALDSAVVHSTGTVDPNAENIAYLYSPSVMYEEGEGLYKFWGCGGKEGDHIVYKEASTLAGLEKAPLRSVLQPNGNSSKFDHSHTCDPSVIKVGNLYYLYYTGINEKEGIEQTSRIGVAVSNDGGKSFSRLNNGNAIVEIPRTEQPYLYGIGQPSVVQAGDGYFYMIYSDIKDGIFANLKIIRSLDPRFLPSSQEYIATFSGDVIGGVSVNLANSPYANELMVAVNTVSNNPKTALVKTLYLDLASLKPGKNPEINPDLIRRSNVYAENVGFRFGESIAVVRNSEGVVHRSFSGGKSSLTFVASTFNEELLQQTNNIWKNYNFDTSADKLQIYGFGNTEDEYLVGDWNGDGTDNLAVRRDNEIWMDIDLKPAADKIQTYGFGNNDDEYLVGDWNGDGVDNLAVRRGNEILMDTNFDLWSDLTQRYGRGNSEDEYLVGDWDGDGKDNLAVRQDNKVWMDYNFDGRADLIQTYGFGNNDDEYLVGDWDGDGKDNLAVRRGIQVFMDTNFDLYADKVQTYGFGNDEAQYLVGDWDGDGKDNLAVRRGDLRAPIRGAVKYVQFYESHNYVKGDLDGDDKPDTIVWNPFTATFEYRLTSEASKALYRQQWGLAEDIPVIFDYNGNGKDDLAVWRPSNGEWFILNKGEKEEVQWQDADYDNIQWGLTGDIPVPGDYNGDGKDDLAVWRPSDSTWYILYKGDGRNWPNVEYEQVQWGLPGDIPLPGAYNKSGVEEIAVLRPSTGELLIKKTLLGSSSLALQSFNGKWVVAEGGGGGELFANRSQVRSWEKFRLDLEGSRKAVGKDSRIFLQAHNKKQLIAEKGGGGRLLANSNNKRSWEKFVITPQDGSLVIRDGSKIALRTHNGHYLKVAYDEDSKVVASSSSVKEWETFTVKVL